MLEKIVSIKGLGVFNGKESFAEDIPFNKYNVLYGYNGSGKTSLSRALRFLQMKTIPDCLKEDNPSISLALQIGGKELSVDSNTVSTINTNIRVFNCDYIWENIRWAKNGSKGIVTVSKEQKGVVEELNKKEKRLSYLDKAINGGTRLDEEGKEHHVNGYQKDIKKAKDGGSALLTECANQQIKNQNWCSDRAYNRTKFEGVMLKVIEGGIAKLSSDQVIKYQNEASSQGTLDTLENISSLHTNDEYKDLLNRISTELKKSASRKVISKLKDVDGLEEWIKQGYKQHLHEGEPCPLCDKEVSKERMEALRAHFSTEVEELENSLRALVGQLKDFVLPAAPIKEKIPTYFAQDLWDNYSNCLEQLKGVQTEVEGLAEKKMKAIESPLENNLNIEERASLYKVSTQYLSNINQKITEHNEFSKKQGEIKRIAETHLIQDVAARNAGKYQESQKRAEKLANELKPLKEEYETLPMEIQKCKESLSKIGRSVEIINGYLKDYLGHDRLQLSLEENGYSVIRNKKKSSAPLSEGEKTALAFCYFIASLHEETNCNLKETIIVVDDPVSSLDSKHINYVFSFMKRRLENAKQLFVLTHNFYFFKECQKSYIRKNVTKNDGTEVIKTILLNLTIKDGYSYLENLPKALKNHESEYHYFASKLFKASEEGWDNPDLYGLANACRRVLESFFCFKLPSNTNLKEKFEIIIRKLEGQQGETTSPVVATSRERFIQVASHSDNLDKILGLDNITLDSVKDAVDFTLEFIKEADDIHFDALKKAA